MKTIWRGILFFSLISGMIVKAEEEDIKKIKKELAYLRKKEENKQYKRRETGAFTLGMLVGMFITLFSFSPDIFGNKPRYFQ